MDDNDFYEDDEPIEDIRAAYEAGDKGITTGRRDINQRAHAIMQAATEEVETSHMGTRFGTFSLRVERISIGQPEVRFEKDSKLTISR